MNPFIQIDKYIINLANVSTINILKGTNRIVFNMNYFIELDPLGKRVSDYVYVDCIDYDQLINTINSILKNGYFLKNFINRPDDGYINKNEISSVKFMDHINRVIFNLSHPIEFSKNSCCKKSTSEFVYGNCTNKSHFKQYTDYINKELLNI